LALEDVILSILKAGSADQYSLFRKLENAKMSDVTKALANLQQTKRIHVTGYRKNQRTGLDFPVYSHKRPRIETLDVQPLLAGITSERRAEYLFVSRNLLPRNKRATVLDVGSTGTDLSRAVESFGEGVWRVLGIDVAGRGSDARMDARRLGLRNNCIDQVICISTIEHVGLGRIKDSRGDIKAMQEIARVLKDGGSVIISLPYANKAQIKEEYRVYDKTTLARLVGSLLAIKKEFYRFRSGKWIKCSRAMADSTVNPEYMPLNIHSAVCACLLLKKMHKGKFPQRSRQS
jgi:SAM-dependent methyltransferase